MSNQNEESRNMPDDALELNKETIQDLDIEPVDAENVKGGTLIISKNCGAPAGQLSFGPACVGGQPKATMPGAPRSTACFG